MTTKATEKPITLAAAMALAFGEIESATKSAPGQVGQQKYKYADLTSVIEAIKPALVSNGLFFTQSPRPNPAGAEIETILHHASGESFSLGSIFVPADRNNAQAFGSALTYARRYALVTAFGVPVEDDDGNAAAAAPPKREPQVELIGDADCVEVTNLLRATKADTKAFLGYFGVPATNKLTTAQAPTAIAMLRKKLAEAAQADTLDDTLEGDKIPY